MRRSFFVRAIFTPTLELMAAVGIAATVVLVQTPRSGESGNVHSPAFKQ